MYWSSVNFPQIKLIKIYNNAVGTSDYMLGVHTHTMNMQRCQNKKQQK